MTAMWIAVIALGAGCYALKLLGLSIPERVLEHPLARRFAELAPIALLAALVAVSTFTSDQTITVNLPVLAGLVAAVIALLLRAPFLVILAAAAIAAALLRLLT